MKLLSLISLLFIAAPFAAFGAPTYVVKPGDILFNIARAHGYSLKDLITANPQIKNPHLIYPGQIIHFPEVNYVVKPGDILFNIARAHGYSLDDLIAANPQIKNPHLIYPGQIINFPEVKYTAKPEASIKFNSAATYVVKPGDILFNIARAHGYSLNDLITANPQIKNPHLIYPGQKINIPK